MGHLINPTGFRLSVLHNWKDNWMSSNSITYSELLHNITSLKEALRDHLRVSTKITPIIYSHFNLEQLSSEKLSLRVYYYDSDIEFKYRDLRYACKRIYRNHKRLYKSFFKMHCHFLPELRLLSKQEKAQFFYASLVRRGFFEYLLLRKLVFLFLCAMVRDDTFKNKDSSLLLQIKLGVFSLLEYNWRKNLFYGKPLNFFEFFIGIFIQMQFLEQNIVNNAIRASLFFYQAKRNMNGIHKERSNLSFGKSVELSFLSKWFNFGRMNLIQNLLYNKDLVVKLNCKLKSNLNKESLNSKNSDDYKSYSEGWNHFQRINNELRKKRHAFLNKKSWSRNADKKKDNFRFEWSNVNVIFKEKWFQMFSLTDAYTNTKDAKTITSYEDVALGYLSKMGSLFYWLSDKELETYSQTKIYYPNDFVQKMYNKAYTSKFKIRSLDYFFKYRTDNSKFCITTKKIFVPSFVENESSSNKLPVIAKDVHNWSLFAYSYIKYSHNLWFNSSDLLGKFLKGRYMSYYNIYSTLSKQWVSMSIWAVNLFLDFYRIFLARTYYIYRFGFNKLNIETKLNKISLLPVEIEFFGFDNDWVTAPFVAFYLARKFEQDFTIKELFKPICRDLKRIATRTPYLLGYKLQFVGRLTRRDRLRTSWVMGGKVPLSTITANVEFGNDFGVLRNGVCSIRVWLYRPRFVGDPSWTYLYKVVF